MFQRKIYPKLLEWKNSDRRKPLILRGARQVGKSTLIRTFATEFANFVELNLEKEQDRKLFDLHSVEDIYQTIVLRNNIDTRKGELLIFIDEIQESSRAIEYLRYFYEELPSVYIVAAGSLLEHALKDVHTFPVGRVQQLLLHPFDFEEFLMALEQYNIIERINKIPCDDIVFPIALQLFHTYCLIGGMPEVIKTYVQEKSIIHLSDVYNEIWQTYKDDIEKYGKNNTEKKVLRHIVETAPHEKDRITMEGFGNSNYKSREVGEALRSLDKSRLIQLVYPIISTKIPQEVDFKRKPHLQFLDSGLLNYAMGIQASLIGVSDLNNLYRGKIIQHIVFQQLQAQFHNVGSTLHFWVRENVRSNSEVDLIYQSKTLLIPIEVKSGSQGKLRSLHQYIEHCDHDFAIRLLANTFSVEQCITPGGKSYKLMNLPYFLAHKIPEYADWFTEYYS